MKKLGEKHDHTANSYESIGRVFMEQENYEKAEEMFQQALDIKLEILPQKISVLTDLYESIGITLQRQGKFSKATKMQKIVLSKLLEMHGEDRPSIVNAYIGIAGLLAHQNGLEDTKTARRLRCSYIEGALHNKYFQGKSRWS